jgi:hypothetical protein
VFFLKAIEISTASRARIASNWYPSVDCTTKDLGDLLRQRELSFQEVEGAPIARDEFLKEVWSYTTDLVTGAPASVVADLKWQFEEFIDLASASLDPSDQFCVLAHRPLYRCVISGERQSVVLLVLFNKETLALFLENQA